MSTEKGTVGHNAYRPNADGLLTFRKGFLLNKLEPPSDKIRKLLTELEFMDAFTPEVTAKAEAVLQLIEAEVDAMRLAMREAPHAPD